MFSPLTAEGALRALIDFTLSNARRFYSSKGNPLDGKGLEAVSCETPAESDKGESITVATKNRMVNGLGKKQSTLIFTVFDIY